MLEIKDFGHSTPEECLNILGFFVQIEDADVREGVLALIEDLAKQTGELWRLVNGEIVTLS